MGKWILGPKNSNNCVISGSRNHRNGRQILLWEVTKRSQKISKMGEGCSPNDYYNSGGGDGKVGSTIAQEMSQRKLSSTQFLEI